MSDRPRRRPRRAINDTTTTSAIAETSDRTSGRLRVVAKARAAIGIVKITARPMLRSAQSASSTNGTATITSRRVGRRDDSASAHDEHDQPRRERHADR